MQFDPTEVPEDSTGEGHLDETPIYEILLKLHQAGITGRLTVEGARGENHMFFMQGRPIGVTLAEVFHPLGQLLLELGHIDAATFIRAQRLISEGSRLPGQVFMELDVLDEDGLKGVLAVQAHRKAEEFCRLGSRPFAFGRGVMFLSGFTSTPLNLHAVLFLAIRQQMGPASRRAWLESLDDKQVKLPEGDLLPAPLESFGFGRPEERFLQRLQTDWQSIGHLADTGTLPNDEMAVLLRFLNVVDRLEVRDLPRTKPAEVQPATEEVFSPGGIVDRSQRNRRSEPGDNTEPRRPIHEVPTNDGPPPPPRPKPKPKPAPVARDAELPRVIVAPEALEPPPRKKKRKKRRSQPLPSTGVSAVMETRKEKTDVGPMPTIILDEE